MDREISDLIDRALAEDVGAGDVTTEATVDAGARARATIAQKAPGVISGLDVAEAVFRRLDPDASIERRAGGRVARAGRAGAAGRGLGAGAADRRADGAELPPAAVGHRHRDRAVVRAVADAGGGAKVLDTRKTTPGLRLLEKRAVAAGGGVNHRVGLFDAILIKENHIGRGGRRSARRCGARASRGRTCRSRSRCATRREIDEALEAGAPRLLLDNMTPEQVARGGRAGRRPRGARGVRRHHPGDSFGLCDHKRARLRLAGRADPFGARARPLAGPGGPPLE